MILLPTIDLSSQSSAMGTIIMARAHTLFHIMVLVRIIIEIKFMLKKVLFMYFYGLIDRWDRSVSIMEWYDDALISIVVMETI